MKYKYLENIKDYINNKGITNISEKELGDLTLSGSSLAQEELPEGGVLVINDIPFELTIEKQFDNIKMDGQEIPVYEKNVQSIYLLACATHGDISENIIIKTSKEILSWELIILDTVHPIDKNIPHYFIMDSMNTQNGKSTLLKPKLYVNEFQFCDKKNDVKKFILPFNPFGHKLPSFRFCVYL
ncbi:hypothetical protein [Listeria seeligeri]|uniref:hypothetical protein n=1 Tax=Listeria seeligeri TaxID=1640 RepID=UPI0001C4E317|nr:hypothetical protein [Listeria seeligeri]MBC1722341.1 hypothetical protein [Listeria seeligeri]MBF2435868.1 hypothetical protein [Listeria seeligeri]CBH27281.1 hypothetical protein lse_1130 [Listeria seeligeri serovar 1/2b str. SLCC3954]